MDAQQFAYWLQGFSELNETPPTAAQWQSIREHLQTVFKKVTPPVGDILKDWKPGPTPGTIPYRDGMLPRDWIQTPNSGSPLPLPTTVTCIATQVDGRSASYC